MSLYTLSTEDRLSAVDRAKAKINGGHARTRGDLPRCIICGTTSSPLYLGSVARPICSSCDEGGKK